MAEENITNEKGKEEHPTDNPGEGHNTEGLTKIERAELAVKRMEEAEKRLDEKISKLTELEANRLLGSTAGGRVEPTPAKVDTPKEYAEKVMKGEIKAT